MDRDDQLRAQIDAVVREPRAWLAEADKLKRAADLLAVQFQNEVHGWFQLATLNLDEDDPDARNAAFALAPAYLMLAGYAVENLAKGLLVVHDTSDATIRRITTKHLSVDMVTDAGIELDGGGPNLVERLAHRVRWAGRYPAPSMRDARAFADSVDKLGPFWGNPMMTGTDDVRRVDELFDRMRGELERALLE